MHKSVRGSVCLLVCVLFLLPALTLAQEEEGDGPGPWSAGARAGYFFLPGGVFDSFYDKHTNISGFFYGVYGSYSFEQFDVVFGVDHNRLFFEDGEWLVAGENDDETDYVEADLYMADLYVQVIWRWNLHEYVDYRLGLGLGLGFPYGEYKSYDVIDGERLDEPDEPDLISVLPIVEVVTGIKVYFIPGRFGMNIDLGIRDGLFAGGGFQGYF